MSYYGAGDYYGAGGYYQAGGIGSFLKKAAGAAVGFVTGGPLGAARAILPRTQQQSLPGPVLSIPTPSSQRIQIAPMAALPGGSPLFSVGGGRRRRRMNFANGRALARANRRTDGFVKLARKSLKHTQYQIVTKGSRKGKRPPSVLVETGPGSIRA